MVKSLKKEIKEIRCNLLSTTPPPLLIPTSINPQILDGKDISRTSSLTLNLLTPVPLVKLTKYLLNSPTYSSKRNKLQSFFNQLENKLNGNINCYTTPNS